MINDYKKCKTTYTILYSICIILILIYLFVWTVNNIKKMQPNSPYNLVMCLIDVLIIVFISRRVIATVCYRIADKEFQKIFNLIQVDCDPFSYVETYYPIAEKQPKEQWYNQLKQLNLSVGYICAGEFDTAIHMLQSLNIVPTKKQDKIMQFSSFMDLCHCYLHKNDLDAAKFYLSQSLPLLNELQYSNQKFAIQFLDVYNSNVHHLGILQGEYIESRAFYEQRFQTSDSNYKRIGLAYRLALIYDKTGEIEKKQEAIDYIKKHGNKLIYVKLAEELESKQQ